MQYPILYFGLIFNYEIVEISGRVPGRGVTEGSKPAAARAFHMAL